MIAIPAFRPAHVCDDDCAPCTDVSTVLYECRHCGTAAGVDDAVCHCCQRDEIVRYVI
ncbi:hypothetical protein ACFQGE_16420 [Halomicroarcula sp. GCM10025817]|uniref:hypothetical protein n=1 Tax=Haloarcula TaxID=2237 RepID=UPI0023E8E1CC|nr:hypothetical protein [Halomicroarcula sp. SYNS111]